MADDVFRWAVLGAGGVSRKFVLALPHAERRHAVHVVASRDREDAAAFAEANAVAHIADDYEAAANFEGVDAVYVATPPFLHEEHALAAIRAGRPVMVEKPFALDAAAAARIAEAARSAGVFCMEGLWSRFMPLMRRVATMIDEGEIGTVRMLDASFLGATTPEASPSQFDPGKGGGALMHRGVYPLSLARMFLGPVVETRANARLGESGVDEDCALVLTHASGAVSTIRASLGVNGASGVSIHGEGGTISFAPVYRASSARIETAEAEGRGGLPRGLERVRETGWFQRVERLVGSAFVTEGLAARRIDAPYAGNGTGHEADALAAAVEAGERESAVMPLDQSIECLAVIDAARAAWARR